MRINSVNNSYSNPNSKNNVSFDGKVGKSVKKYLKNIRKDIIKTKGDEFNLNNVANIKHATFSIKNIMTTLTEFMSKTAPDTELVLERNKSTGALYPYFKNRTTKIRGFAPSHRCDDRMVNIDGVNIKNPILTERSSIPGKGFLGIFDKKMPYTSDNLTPLNRYTEELVNNVKPEDIDRGLSERAVYEAQSKIKKQHDNDTFKLEKKIKEEKINIALNELKNTVI